MFCSKLQTQKSFAVKVPTFAVNRHSFAVNWHTFAVFCSNFYFYFLCIIYYILVCYTPIYMLLQKLLRKLRQNKHEI